MAVFDPEKITFFAKTDARGANVPFGIKAIDRTKHMYVIGKTGMGKSTMLENMAVQDIQNGEGMAFIDPHGQTAETLLDYVPEERKGDVLYFAPFDTENPVAFNVMEDVGADKRHLVVSGLMSVFKKIWVDAWSARMEYILQNTLLALLEYPDSTLLGVNRMLSDKVYRKKVIDNITDPAVKSFWVDEFLNYNERYMQEAGDSIKNKIGQFTANPLIRNVIGQPRSSFDLRKIMDERKIIIMNLSKGLVGESNANLLGSMLTTRIYLAAMSRADLDVGDLKQMPNFYFYVDEFQSFANATFADILSEARKYKLNLTIAHQYIEQMEEEVKNAVFGNVGTIVSFRVGPFDAEVLESIYAPNFYAVDICNLGFAQIYLTLMIDGIGSKPFSATTLPPIQPKAESCKQMVIHQSRQQFAKPRAEVEGSINAWHEPMEPEPKKSAGPSGEGSGANGGRSHSGSNQSGGGQREGRGDGKKPVKKERDLSDLRAVLKGMAPEPVVSKAAESAKKSTEQREPKTEDNQTALAKAVEPVQSERSDKSKLDKPDRSEKKNEERITKKNQDPKRTDVAQGKKVEEQSGPSETAEKNQAELRAVLQSLSEKTKQEEKKPTAQAKEQKRAKAERRVKSEQPKKVEPEDKRPAKFDPEPIVPAKEQKKPAAKPRSVEATSLRSALAKAIGSEEKLQSVQETKADETVVAKPTATAPAAQPAKADPPYTEIKSKDPLDPKLLERMMRVSINDKPPLK